MEEYLKPTSAIDCGSSSIKEKAQELVNGQETIREKAKRLFYFVRDKIQYDPFTPKYLAEHYRATTILHWQKGYCVQKAILLAALARAADIPARLRFADIRNNIAFRGLTRLLGTDLLVFHGYDELYIEGKWVKADPSLDLRTYQINRGTPVEFDAKNDALLPTYNQSGEPLVEYLRDHGHYQDVPLDEIMRETNRAYGHEGAKRFNFLV